MQNKIVNDIKIDGDKRKATIFSMERNNGNILIKGSIDAQLNTNKKRIRHLFNVNSSATATGYVLIFTLKQAKYLLDSGEYFWLKFQFTGPYKTSKFLCGYNENLPMPHAITTSEIAEAAAKGYFEFKALIPPKNGHIILEILSENKIEIKSLKLSQEEIN